MLRPPALAALTDALPPGARPGEGNRPLIVFDRGAAFPFAFTKVDEAGYDWLTWRRAPLAATTLLPVLQTITTRGHREREVAWTDEQITLKDYAKPVRQLTLFEHGTMAAQAITGRLGACPADLAGWLRGHRETIIRGLAGTITYTPKNITVTLDQPGQGRVTRALTLLLAEINTRPPILPGDGPSPAPSDSRCDCVVTTSDCRRSEALSLVEGLMMSGEWTDPQRGKVTLQVYAEKWIAQRPNLRPRTVELYTWLLTRHIGPQFGRVPVGKISPERVREWRATLLGNGVSVSATAKAYRLLRAVLMTATEDRIIPRNPCRIRGGGDEKPAERPVLTVAQVFDLADRMKDRRYRALVLLVAFASLRWGEAIALRRSDIDLEARSVSIRRQYVETTSQLAIGPPKSRAGTRTVGIPKAIIPALREHFDAHVGAEETALVFAGARGGVLRRGNFRRGSGWAQAVAKLGVPGLHFHDLRHTGNMLAAPGTNLADLKARMGHDSARAAMIYQNPRVLHQAGEKSQVTRSRRYRNSVSTPRTAAV
jgi:integrase